MANEEGRRKSKGYGDSSHPDRAEEAPQSRLDLAYFPAVPESARPRHIVFDSVHEDDVKALESKGYRVICLRVLPRRNPKEERDFFLALMQGVSEGTILLTKSRSDGLFYELKSRGFLDKKNFDGRKEDQHEDEGLAGVLAWNDSSHAFTGNTTMLAPEQVQSWARSVVEFDAAAQAAAAKQKKNGKRP